MPSPTPDPKVVEAIAERDAEIARLRASGLSWLEIGWRVDLAPELAELAWQARTGKLWRKSARGGTSDRPWRKSA
jgi:hypothetical protein